MLQKLAEEDDAALLSALSLVELQRGLYKTSAYAALRRLRLDVLMEHILVIPFDAAAAKAYGHIIAQCGWVKAEITTE